MSILLDFLKELEVQKVYFCSGARNYPLLDSLKELNIVHEFDERVASFMALGEAKITQKPVVICMTSGTAVAECLPAMIEAFYGDIPLIVISADRPARLRHSHAPQAIDQTNIFSAFTGTKYTGSMTDFQKQPLKFPMHINIEIDDRVEAPQDSKLLRISESEVISLHKQASSILFLFTEDKGQNQILWDYLGSKNAYLYKECTANLKGNFPNQVMYEFQLVELLKNNTFDLIYKIGKTPINKIWRLLDQKFFDLPVISLGDYPVGLSHGHIHENKNVIKTLTWEHLQSPLISESNLNILCRKFSSSEPAIIKNLIHEIPNNSLVMLGNSMPIRYGQMFIRDDLEYTALRGANGIDGLISSAIGMAKSLKKQVHLILGDLSFLYDVGALNRDVPKNLFIHVINNHGGRIFERINLSQEIQNRHEDDLQRFQEFYSHLNLKIHFVENGQTQKFWEELS